MRLGYLNDNAASHSVDSDIFYVVLHLPGQSKSYIKPSFLKVVSIPVFVCINFMQDNASIAGCDKVPIVTKSTK